MREALAVGIFLTVVGLLVVPAVNAAQGNDELWEITTKMDMPGMPMQMADQVTQSCLPQGKPGEQATVTDSSCEVAESKQSGNKTTFKMVCGDTTMAGETVYSGDNFKTTMHMTRNGKQQMTQTMTGKRIGRCDVKESQRQVMAQLEAPKHVPQMSPRQKDRMCKIAVKNLDRQSLSLSGCGDRSSELCQRVAEVESDPKDYFSLTKLSKTNWEESARNCKKDPAKVHQKVCKQAINEADSSSDWNRIFEHCNTESAQLCDQAVEKQAWDTVVKHCKSEAKANANMICAGRGVSGVYYGDYEEICSQYAKKELEDNSRKDSGSSANDLLTKEGTRKLKSLLGF